MTRKTHYQLGADVRPGELRDGRGRLIDDEYVARAVEDAVRVRGRGRPSLSHSGESPLLRVRLPQDLDDAVRKAAEHAGVSRAEWVREVLSEATRRAG